MGPHWWGGFLQPVRRRHFVLSQTPTYLPELGLGICQGLQLSLEGGGKGGRCSQQMGGALLPQVPGSSGLHPTSHTATGHGGGRGKKGAQQPG